MTFISATSLVDPGARITGIPDALFVPGPRGMHHTSLGGPCPDHDRFAVGNRVERHIALGILVARDVAGYLHVRNQRAVLRAYIELVELHRGVGGVTPVASETRLPRLRDRLLFDPLER